MRSGGEGTAPAGRSSACADEVSVIVVTGGTGTLGTHAVRVLSEHGHDVRVLSRRTGVDLAASVGVDEAVTGADLVRDAAANRRRVGASDPKQTRTLVAACGRVRNLVYVSISGGDYPY
jgi:nucleoside-diphosphate-sugar epimerase